MWITHVFQIRLLYTALDDPRRADVVLMVQFAGDDGCADLLRCVDDFLDTWDPLCDTHTSNARKMEGLQRHLCAGLSNGLSSHGPNSMAWFRLGFLVFLEAGLNKGR